MTSAEALRVIAVLTAYFRQELSGETAVLWAKELREYQAVDALAAARECATHSKFMPSLAEFLAGVREARNQRAQVAIAEGSFSEGMSLTEYLEQNPEMREAADRMGWFRAALEATE